MTSYMTKVSVHENLKEYEINILCSNTKLSSINMKYVCVLSSYIIQLLKLYNMPVEFVLCLNHLQSLPSPHTDLKSVSGFPG